MPARFPMTSPHNNPQGTAGSEQTEKEYIITEKQLHRLTGDLITFEEAAPIEKATRSRPHTRAPTPALESVPEVSTCNHSACRVYGPCIDAYEDYEAPPCAKYQTKEYNTAIRAEAAKAERERVLDDLVYWMYDCPFGGREGSDRCHTILAHKIESLRHQQGNNNRMEQ